MSVMDRAKLEKAMESLCYYCAVIPDDERALLLQAAKAHLATLPKTKMVDVWRVEWWSGACVHAEHYGHEPNAKRRATLLALNNAKCVRIVHAQQEVPDE